MSSVDVLPLDEPPDDEEVDGFVGVVSSSADASSPGSFFKMELHPTRINVTMLAVTSRFIGRLPGA